MALRQTLHHLYRGSFRRAFCAPAQPAIGIKAEELLGDADLQAILHEHQKQASDDIFSTPDLRLALLQRLSTRTGRPVASDAFNKLRSAEEMARWFAKSLRPLGARPHAKGMIREQLGGDGEVVDKRIDEEGDVVKEEFLKGLPVNLHIDPKTFAMPEKTTGKKRRKGHIARKVREQKVNQAG